MRKQITKRNIMCFSSRSPHRRNLPHQRLDISRIRAVFRMTPSQLSIGVPAKSYDLPRVSQYCSVSQPDADVNDLDISQ